jgi:hypothetical protein
VKERRMATFIIFTVVFAAVSAFNIDCNYEMWKAWDFPIQYSCKVMNITLTGSKSLENVTGTHKYLKGNSNVKQFNFGYDAGNCKKLNFIPQNIDKHFPNFIGMLFYDCHIMTLTGDELKDYVNLEWFAIERDLIETIPSGLFVNNLNLNFVSFYNNHIAHVGPELFDGLEGLTSIGFLKNVCIDEQTTGKSRSEAVQFIEKLKAECPYVDGGHQMDPCSCNPHTGFLVLAVILIVLGSVLALFKYRDCLSSNFSRLRSEL